MISHNLIAEVGTPVNDRSVQPSLQWVNTGEVAGDEL
jgi:hypothetical protein